MQMISDEELQSLAVKLTPEKKDKLREAFAAIEAEAAAKRDKALDDVIAKWLKK